MPPEETSIAQSGPTRRGRAPQWTGVALLVVAMVAAGIPTVRLGVVEALPATALLAGIRMPGGLPRLGVPFGDDVAIAYWAVETVAAAIVLGTYWWCAQPRSDRSGRLRTAARVWSATVLAVLAGCLTAAVSGSFVTGDRPLAYLLLVAGTALFAVAWGAVAGLFTAVAAALVPQG